MPREPAAGRLRHADPLSLREPITASLLTVAAAWDDPGSPYLTELVRQGGRRFRSRLLVEVALSGDRHVSVGHVVKLAVGLELIHLASLVHDDIADGADERRGVPSPRSALGDERVLLLGLGCAVSAAELVAEVGPAFSVAFAAGTRRLALGQLRDVERAGVPLTLAEYLTMVSAKTGTLMALGVELGASLQHELRSDQLAQLRVAGNDLGIAFQLADDLEDLRGVTSGKPAGLDTRNESVLPAPAEVVADLARQRLATARASWASVLPGPWSVPSAFDDVARRLALVAA